MDFDKDSGSLRLRIFNAIEDAILDGRYNEGDSLNEIKLSQEFGVSRTPVREALMQLEHDGLVKNKNYYQQEKVLEIFLKKF